MTETYCKEIFLKLKSDIQAYLLNWNALIVIVLFIIGLCLLIIPLNALISHQEDKLDDPNYICEGFLIYTLPSIVLGARLTYIFPMVALFFYFLSTRCEDSTFSIYKYMTFTFSLMCIIGGAIFFSIMLTSSFSAHETGALLRRTNESTWHCGPDRVIPEDHIIYSKNPPQEFNCTFKKQDWISCSFGVISMDRMPLPGNNHGAKGYYHCHGYANGSRIPPDACNEWDEHCRFIILEEIFPMLFSYCFLCAAIALTIFRIVVTSCPEKVESFLPLCCLKDYLRVVNVTPTYGGVRSCNKGEDSALLS